MLVGALSGHAAVARARKDTVCVFPAGRTVGPQSARSRRKGESRRRQGVRSRGNGLPTRRPDDYISVQATFGEEQASTMSFMPQL